MDKFDCARPARTEVVSHSNLFHSAMQNPCESKRDNFSIANQAKVLDLDLPSLQLVDSSTNKQPHGQKDRLTSNAKSEATDSPCGEQRRSRATESQSCKPGDNKSGALTDGERDRLERKVEEVKQLLQELLGKLGYAPIDWSHVNRPALTPRVEAPVPKPEAPQAPRVEAPAPKPEAPQAPRVEAPAPKPEAPQAPRVEVPREPLEHRDETARPGDSAAKWSPRSSLADLTHTRNNYWSNVPTSYWFESLPQNLKLVDSRIQPEGEIWNDTSRLVDTRKYKASELVDMPVYDSLGGWKNNEPGDLLRTIKWPKGVEFPRVNSMNNSLTVIQPDGTDMSFNKAHVKGNKIIATDRSGAHGGSATSAAGVITYDEMEGLRQGVSPSHKIQLTLWGKYLSNEEGGKRHPSMKADRGWQELYQGDVPELRMGSTLTFPQSMKPEDLGLETKQGKALFYTMQKYGAVIVDDSASGTHYIQTESQTYKDGTPLLKDRRRPQEDPFARDINRLFSKSKVVA